MCSPSVLQFYILKADLIHVCVTLGNSKYQQLDYQKFMWDH